MGKVGDIATIAAVAAGGVILLKVVGGIGGLFGGVGEFFGGIGEGVRGIFGGAPTLAERIEESTERVGEAKERIVGLTERVKDIITQVQALAPEPTVTKVIVGREEFEAYKAAPTVVVPLAPTTLTDQEALYLSYGIPTPELAAQIAAAGRCPY